MIKKFFDLKLTPFIIIVLFFSLLLPSFVSSYVLVYQEKQRQVQELHRFKKGVSKLLAASLAIPLWEVRVDSAMTALEPILEDDRIAFIKVVDVQTNEVFIDIKNDKIKGNIVEAKEDIFNNTTRIGQLHIGISDYFMQVNLQESISHFIVVFIFQLIVSAFILSFAIYFKIIKPMTKLSNQAKQLSQNQLNTSFIWNKKDEIGKLGRGLEYARDSLQQTLVSLKNQKQRLENIIEGTNVGTWEWNIQTGDVVFNDKWAHIIGYELSELEPSSIHTWSKFSHPHDLKVSNQELLNHFNGFRDYYEVEARMRHKDGYWVWVLDRGKVIEWDENQKPLIMAGTHQDITLKKEQEEKLEQLNTKLKDEVSKQVEQIMQKDKLLQEQAKLAAMGEMIGAIAHQWRQPLNALSINIQNLDDDYEDGLIDEGFIEDFIQNQTKTIDFMSKTIDDFRNFFKTDKSKGIFSMQKVARSVKHLLVAQMSDHNIDLSINDEDFEINGYKSEMQQVILNVISNAKDAIIENKINNGQIHIYIDAKQKKLFIEDNGGGVDEDKIDRIFEPYYTTKEQGKGTGIGLHMSRIIIVEHMQGNINAYNTPKGLCMEIGF